MYRGVRDSKSSESVSSDPGTPPDEAYVQKVRKYIWDSKSLGCSPETSASSAREVVSESFVDVLTEGEIDEIRKKLFNYWERHILTGENPKIEPNESKATMHQKCDPNVQYEEAVPSFEDAKSEGAASTVGIQDVATIIEKELRSIRESKLSESDVEVTGLARMRRSDQMDFTELIQKAADLPSVSDATASKPRRQLPVLRKTDHLEVVLRVYDFTGTGSSQHANSASSIDEQISSEISKGKDFRKYLVFEMQFLYLKLTTRPRVQSIKEESENESSSLPTKDLPFSSKEQSLISPIGQSSSGYPKESTKSVSAPQTDDTLAGVNQSLDSDSPSGLVNSPVINMPEGAKKIPLAESGNSNSTSSTVFSDDTLSNISSLPTDTRTSVSSSRDIEALPNTESKVQLQIDDANDDDAFVAPPLTPGDAAPSHLSVPQIPGLPLSFDNSSENAKAEDIDNDRHRRERSPKEDDDERSSKRQAT